MTIPRSEWVLYPRYFKAILKYGQEFKEKYLEWYKLENLYEDLSSENFSDVEKVVDKWLQQEYLVLCQFPEHRHGRTDKEIEDESDYFEKEDGNFLLKRWMFEVYDNRLDALEELSNIDQQNGEYL